MSDSLITPTSRDRETVRRQTDAAVHIVVGLIVGARTARDALAVARSINEAVLSALNAREAR